MKKKISITIEDRFLKYIDSLIDNSKIKNRSQAIESIVKNFLEVEKKAIILAGGSESVLRYKNTYKPLMKIEGKEIIKNTVEILSKYGVKEVMIATPIANKIIPLFNDMQQVNFIYIDDNCSGTAGAVKLCEKYINSDFFVVASDIYFDFDLNKMMMFHKSHGGLVTIATTTTRLNESKDQIEFEGNRVIKFDYGSRERTFSINAGIYAMSPKIFEIIPKKGSLEKDVFPKLTSEGKIYAYNFSGKWIHIS
ncbi:MAG: hypothetical protein KQA36_03085 [Candidatus Aenigmarchaeota archaeon]|nr:hypothetical protein [Candidatus Aenigmarchaeota archaeon]